MRFLYRTLITALRALRRNVMRSSLTALGIIIGVAAVIAMENIGQGSSTAVQQTIKSMGANNLLIMPGTASSGGVSFGSGSIITLTPDDAEAVGRECPAVMAVAPIVRARCQVVYGNRNWVPMYIYGTTPEFLEVRDWQEMDEGDVFSDRDVRNGSKVCLLGQTLVRELFGDESPLNKEVRVQNVSFKVVGVLSRKGANMMGLDQDDILLAPWTTIKYRVSGATLENVNQSSAQQAAASGSVKTARSSGTASGTGRRFAAGSCRNSAKAPSRPTMPSTVRAGQWRGSPARQSGHAQQPAFISPTTRRPTSSGAPGALSTTPTNSWPGVPRKPA